MYPRKKSNISTETKSQYANSKVAMKNTDNINKFTGMKSYIDSDLARDLSVTRSTSSSIHEYNGVVFSWNCTKQSAIMDCTNRSEIKALFKGTKKTKIFRRFLESAGRLLRHPTPTYEDNDATISQILKDRLTPRIKHLDIPMTILHEDH